MTPTNPTDRELIASQQEALLRETNRAALMVTRAEAAEAALRDAQTERDEAVRDRRYIIEGLPDPFDGEPLTDFMRLARAEATEENEQYLALQAAYESAVVDQTRLEAAEARVQQLKAALEEIRDQGWGETTIIGHICRTALADVKEEE